MDIGDLRHLTLARKSVRKIEIRVAPAAVAFTLGEDIPTRAPRMGDWRKSETSEFQYEGGHRNAHDASPSTPVDR